MMEWVAGIFILAVFFGIEWFDEWKRSRRDTREGDKVRGENERLQAAIREADEALSAMWDALRANRE